MSVRSLILPFKIAMLALVFVRFHGSFVGLAVVLGMSVLWFGMDRSLWRWIDRRLGAATGRPREARAERAGKVNA